MHNSRTLHTRESTKISFCRKPYFHRLKSEFLFEFTWLLCQIAFIYLYMLCWSMMCDNKLFIDFSSWEAQKTRGEWHKYNHVLGRDDLHWCIRYIAIAKFALIFQLLIALRGHELFQEADHKAMKLAKRATTYETQELLHTQSQSASNQVDERIFEHAALWYSMSSSFRKWL